MNPLDQVLAIHADALRVPLDPRATKVLYFMLRDAKGCDATVASDRFVIQYGWHPSHHRYFVEIAPAITSWLHDVAPLGYLAAGTMNWWWAPDEEVEIEIFGKGLHDRRSLPPHWSFGARRIWYAVSPERFVIQVRDAALEHAEPLEPPIEYLATDHACPRCGAVPERYRKLRDGWLVCQACGASSPPP